MFFRNAYLHCTHFQVNFVNKNFVYLFGVFVLGFQELLIEVTDGVPRGRFIRCPTWGVENYFSLPAIYNIVLPASREILNTLPRKNCCLDNLVQNIYQMQTFQ